jgi:hypothetical protein
MTDKLNQAIETYGAALQERSLLLVKIAKEEPKALQYDVPLQIMSTVTAVDLMLSAKLAQELENMPPKEEDIKDTLLQISQAIFKTPAWTVDEFENLMLEYIDKAATVDHTDVQELGTVMTSMALLTMLVDSTTFYFHYDRLPETALADILVKIHLSLGRLMTLLDKLIKEVNSGAQDE